MDPFIGQISITGFNYAPRGWALCNGQLLAIAQNQALFSLLGTTYGGNGVTTFALPDLRGRAAQHGPQQGVTGGVENVQLNQTQIPAHTHQVNAITAEGTTASPTGAVWAGSPGSDLQYTPAATVDTLMAANAIGPGGADQPHSNMPPSTVMNFIIALQGIFPSRN